MSAFNKMKQFEDEAKAAEAEFAEIYPPDEPEGSNQEAVTEATTTSEPTSEPSTPEPTPENEWEKKYKDSLKGMNEAQRKASETVKAKEDAEKRATDLEARLSEALEAAKNAKSTKTYEPVDDDDDLEADMPEVAKIAKKYASRAQKDLEAKLSEITSRLKAEEDNRKRVETDASTRKMRDDIVSVHPDYDQLVNSEEMTAWINNEAPPIYKAIFEGAVPFHAKDAIAVLNAFKSTTSTPTQTKASPSTPSAAEVAAPVKTNTPISTRLKTDAPLTSKDLDYFMHNSHKMKGEELAEWDRRFDNMTKT